MKVQMTLLLVPLALKDFRFEKEKLVAVHIIEQVETRQDVKYIML
jgi:hypothetical protein